MRPHSTAMPCPTAQVLPTNLFTRRRADLRGSQLHLPGLIKAIATQYNYKRYFATRTAGAKRNYNICLLIDISMSMRGIVGDCAVECLVLLATALLDMQIDNFSLAAFGERVHVIKRSRDDWDPAAMVRLLQTLSFERDVATRDAEAIDVGLKMLDEGPSGAPRKMFVLTDGFSSNNWSLAAALLRAHEGSPHTEVVAIAPGLRKHNIRETYAAGEPVPPFPFMGVY